MAGIYIKSTEIGLPLSHERIILNHHGGRYMLGQFLYDRNCGGIIAMIRLPRKGNPDCLVSFPFAGNHDLRMQLLHEQTTQYQKTHRSHVL